MATKKRKGLAGTPKQHMDKAAELLEEATEGFDYAESAVDNRRCGLAFSHYIDAVRSRSEANAHELYVKRQHVDAQSIYDQELRVERKIKSTCLVGAGLSGLRRRKARR